MILQRAIQPGRILYCDVEHIDTAAQTIRRPKTASTPRRPHPMLCTAREGSRVTVALISSNADGGLELHPAWIKDAHSNSLLLRQSCYVKAVTWTADLQTVQGSTVQGGAPANHRPCLTRAALAKVHAHLALWIPWPRGLTGDPDR